MIKVERSHSYDAIGKVVDELSVFPMKWLEDIRGLSWVIYPDGLSPLFTGLMKEERTTQDGRLCSESVGWYSWGVSDNVTLRDKHIFLVHSRVDAVVHEQPHALSHEWHVDEEEFYKPETAFHWYMASSPAEYFACALDVFLRPVRDDRNGGAWYNRWNKEDLGKAMFY